MAITTICPLVAIATKPVKSYTVQMKLALAFLIVATGLNAGTIVFGGPLGVLTDARIDIPLDPDNSPIPLLSASSSYSQTFTMDVTGGAGTGYLFFDVYESAESFGGNDGVESMDSFSGVSSPFSLATPPYIPQGSTPASCYYAAPCALEFTFGVPQQVTFTAYSYVSYSYNDFMALPVSPLLAGSSLESSVTLGGLEADFSDFRADPSAVVTFSTPEPGGLLLFGIGTLALCFGSRVLRNRRGTAHGDFADQKTL